MFCRMFMLLLDIKRKHIVTMGCQTSKCTQAYYKHHKQCLPLYIKSSEYSVRKHFFSLKKHKPGMTCLRFMNGHMDYFMYVFFFCPITIFCLFFECTDFIKSCRKTFISKENMFQINTVLLKLLFTKESWQIIIKKYKLKLSGFPQE